MNDGHMKGSPLEVAAPGQDVVREQDKIMLVLAYLGILSLIPLLTVKDSEYVKWHAKQGLAIAILYAAWIILGIVLGSIPFLGIILGCVGFLGFLAVTVMAIVKAFKPMRWEIPLVSLIASKF